MSEELLHGPVHEAHVALGATFAPFGGWTMPVSYAGTVSEHTSTRTTAGLFDVSHLGKAVVSGPGAAAYVDSVLTNALDRIGPGQAQYTLCCTENGGVVDDLIAYLVSDDEVFLVPNAANTAAVVEVLAQGAPAGIEVRSAHREYGVLAVQGPRSADVLAAVGLPSSLDYMAFEDVAFGSGSVRVCRTGYTGEHGYELLPQWDTAASLFEALLGAVREVGGEPAGLGARDTLRTEMGYPLHGHELSVDISPLEARCGWAVGWKKDEFRGRDALVAQKEAGAPRTLVGLRAVGRGVLRPDLTVLRPGIRSAPENRSVRPRPAPSRRPSRWASRSRCSTPRRASPSVTRSTWTCVVGRSRARWSGRRSSRRTCGEMPHHAALECSA